MKKFTFMLAGLLAVVLFSFGCSMLSKNSESGSAKVIETPGSETGDQKVVTFYVVGKGLEPENATTKGEAKLLAERAAVADGYRQFVEKIRGVYVEAFMKAGAGTVNHDVIKTKTQSWLRGVDVIEIRQGEYDITEAHMQLRINFTKKGMVWWPSGIATSVLPS